MRKMYLWLINIMMFTFQDNISTPKVHEKLHENEARVSTEIIMMIAFIQSYSPLSSRLTMLLSHGILSEWLAFFAIVDDDDELMLNVLRCQLTY